MHLPRQRRLVATTDSDHDESFFLERSRKHEVNVPNQLWVQVQAAIEAINPNLPLAEVRTLDAILAQSMARTSFTLVMLAIAAAVALALGVVGIYGVIS